MGFSVQDLGRGTSTLQESILRFLLETQNSDGSWGYTPGKLGALEPTAYACLSLFGIPSARVNLQKGIESIRSAQSPEGGWTVSVSDNQPTSWATALAGFALLNLEGLISASGLAANFLLNAAQRTPRNWILKMAEWMQSWDSSYVDQNLRGWNWNSGTATWIEPTAYGLIFLKKFRSMGGWAHDDRAHKLNEINREADELIYARACKEGGWNYGNSLVLGEELRPYPLTTALALIALQDSPDRTENRKGREYLKRSIDDEKSALALSFAALSLQIYGVETSRIRQKICDLYAATQFFSNIRTTALALLAQQSEDGKNCFKF